VLQIGQSLFGVGQAALAGIVALNSDWRALSTIMAMPMLMAIFIWFFNDESARWLISRNRIDEANQILRKIAKVNGREVKNKYVFEESKDDEESDTPAESLTNAIKLPRMRGMILNLCYQVTDHSPLTSPAVKKRSPIYELTFSGLCYLVFTMLLQSRPLHLEPIPLSVIRFQDFWKFLLALVPFSCTNF